MKNEEHRTLDEACERHLSDFFSAFDPRGEFADWRNRIMSEFRELRAHQFGQSFKALHKEKVEVQNHSIDDRELDRR